MNQVIKVCAVILVLNCLIKSCYGVSVIFNVLGNKKTEQPVSWADGSDQTDPEEKRKSEPKKEYALLMDLYEQPLFYSIENDNIESSNERVQDSETTDKIDYEGRRKRQSSWGYTTSLYPKLPTQSPNANYNPSSNYNTQWQPSSPYNNHSLQGYSYNASSFSNYNSSRPNPYNAHDPSYNQNQPNKYPSNYPYNQPSYRPPYATSNGTNLRPQGNSHSTYPYYSNTNQSYPYNRSQRPPTNSINNTNYGQHHGHTNTSYPYNPSQRPPTYSTTRPNNNQDVSGYTSKYPVIYQNTTSPRTPYSFVSTKNSTPSYPNYNPVQNTLFNNVSQNRTSNNASVYPYQPQNPNNRPAGQGSNNGTYSYQYPSGQQQPGNPYSGGNPSYNQYSGYPQPNNSPYGHAPSYNDPTPRPYNAPYNSQNSQPYPSSGATGYSNGIGPHYTPSSDGFPVNNSYPGNPTSNGTNAYSFGNSYNPRIPSQPPNNNGGDPSYFYYIQKLNNTQEDPTRVSPNRFSY